MEEKYFSHESSAILNDIQELIKCFSDSFLIVEMLCRCEHHGQGFGHLWWIRCAMCSRQHVLHRCHWHGIQWKDSGETVAKI
jgi:hypothetical protein